MKIKIFCMIFLGIAGLFAPVHAQNTWKWIAPSIPTNRAYSATAIGNSAYFLCSTETVVATHDGGQTFVNFQYKPVDDVEPGDDYFHRIAFCDSATGILIGTGGIYRTEDSGQHWMRIFPQGYSFSTCTFVDGRYGWLFGVSGGKYTFDKGQSWYNVWDDSLFAFPRTFTKVFAVNKDSVWVLKRFHYNNGGDIFFSPDGGQTWMKQNYGMDSNPSNQVYFYDMLIKPSGFGYIIGGVYRPDSSYFRSLIFRTKNFGQSWSVMEYDKAIYHTIISPDDSTWILIGNQKYQGIISISTDSGYTWNSHFVSIPNQNYTYISSAVYFPESQTILVYAGGYYKSRDRGQTFQRVSDPYNFRINDFDIDHTAQDSNQLAVAISSKNKYLLSRDGGRTWHLDSLSNSFYSLKKVSVVDSTIFMVVNGYYLYRSIDFGANWDVIFAGYDIRDLYAYSRDNVVINLSSYINQRLSITYDAGNTWITAPYVGNFLFEGIILTAPSTVYAWGKLYENGKSRGIVFHSTNGGLSWRVTDLPFRYSLENFASLGQFIALVNDKYTVYRTTNAGKNWHIVLQSNDYYTYYSAMAFKDSLQGEMRVSHYFMKTSDGGNNWIKQSSYYPVWGKIQKMMYNNRGDLIAQAGTGELLIRYNQNGNSVRQPSIFSTEAEANVMMTSFPNPFNARTHIRIFLATESQIGLSVYDVLGRKVAELASGKFIAGEHDFEFDGNTLASGIYILVLQTNNGKTVTRKMMLLK